MMGKYRVMLVALLAVFAFSAVAASAASAHEWLTLGGAAIAKNEAATTTGSWSLRVIKIPALEGGGELTILCDGQLLGTVGPKGSDTITLVESLTGTEQDKLKCEVSASTNSVCKAGTLVILTPAGLPWSSLLILLGAEVFDDLAAKEVGYSTTCAITNKCVVSLELPKFVKNVASGSEFEFDEFKALICITGSEVTAKGKVTVLNFLAN